MVGIKLVVKFNLNMWASKKYNKTKSDFGNLPKY